MSATYYFILWTVYAAGLMLALVFFWRWTRWPRLWWLGSLVRILALALLLTPAEQAPGSGLYAPAWIVMLFDELQRIGDGWFRAGINLMAALALALLVYFVHLIFSFFHRRRRLKKA